MNERLLELQSVLSGVRRRWTQRAMLRAWTVGALAATAVLLAGLGAVLVVAREGVPLVFTIAVVAAVALFALGRALWPLRRTPTDRQLARFIEERSPNLDDVLVTAVDYAARPDSSPQMRECLADDAVRAARGVQLDDIVSSRSMRVWALRGAAAAAALAIVAALVAPSFGKATSLAAAYLFPTRLGVEVTPGSAKVRAGEPVTITARVAGVEGGLTPVLTVALGDASRDLRMEPGDESGTFQVTLENVTNTFGYHVAAATARSEDYTISVIRPPRVERIDVSYEFPKGLGLEPRTDEDSGDIYGPAGTKVRLTIVADKPIIRASLKLDDGSSVELQARDEMLDGQITIEDDGSYRIALADVDGLENAGETEYFIRTLDDRPPDVRILRPAGDKKVTPLEEVEIEARADDDYGIASFDLVFQAPGGKEKVVPFRWAKGGLTADGLHTMFMEDLGVQPGDFVTYFARARDVSRGRRSVEARSDIFFLEVKPFEEEFVAATSQAMGGGGGDRNLQQLAEAQKEIIVATWKLDARARRAKDAKPARDIREVSKAQTDLKTRAEEVGGQMSRTLGDPRRRRGRGGPAPTGNDPMGKAIEAMGRAAGELEKLDTSAALPHEMEALNQLLKAEAENKRRQVARQQQAGGGGGMNRSEADLSSLFDQELRKRNQTNYETPTSTEERQDTKKQDDPLEKIRELARRQAALARQQRDLARQREQIEEEELKRQLERLTREQNQLRQEADQLSRQMAQRGGQSQQSQRTSGQPSSGQQSSGQSSGQGQSSQGQQGTRQLREIAEEMRNAASDLRRQNPDQASARSERATERLRELERQLQTARPDDRRRALGDLQLESKQLADAQRRLANEASKTGQGQPGQDARRRLAGDQERLADRAERLQESVKRFAKGGEGDADERQATEEAARELERQRLAERMRKSAESLRGNGEAKQGEDIAQALDQVARRLGAASGAQDADSRRLSDQLAKTQELRERIAGLERDIAKLQRAGEQQGAQQQGQPGGEQGRSGAEGQPGQQQGQQGQAGQQAQGQQAGQGAQSSQSQGGGEGAANAREGSGGEQGGNGLQKLQRDVNERMREANRLADEIGREHPGLQGAKTPEEWWRSFSAPGTEAFKQDFARWESLKKNLLVALESVESNVSDQLRAKENVDRLNAGGHDSVSESYRQLVEKYYRSLAAPRKPQ